jgi:prepilin-type N-terminal cleavage/methylation domain-containing protein
MNAFKSEIRRPALRAGFTLVELVISSSLMTIILVSAYLCLHGAISTQRLIEPRVEVIQTGRVVLAQMSADLRCACPLSKENEFLGVHRMSGDVEADSVDFATHNYTPRHPREGDFCAVSFFLDKDPQTGRLSLWRRRNPTIPPNPLSGGIREELADGVAGLRFEYSDGYEWYESWGDAEGRGKLQDSLRYHGNLEGLPDAVRITLWLDVNSKPGIGGQTGTETSTNEPPLVFQTVARINLAPAVEASRSSSASAEGNSAAGTSAATSGATQGGNR